MAVLGEIHTELGPVHGIFHAAGVMRDGIIQEKSREQALSVLAPKLLGTLAIDRAIEHFAPSFVVLFSSTSAISGLPGQIDYTSANAFLDAFAHSRNGSDTRFISLNWGIWGEVGMAAKGRGPGWAGQTPAFFRGAGIAGAKKGDSRAFLDVFTAFWRGRFYGKLRSYRLPLPCPSESFPTSS